jgi:signal transduction histidine kinase
VKGKVNIGSFDLPHLMTERVKSLQLAADQKSIRVSYQAEGEPLMNSDANYISRIVDNLISNAIKFSPTGSSVEVRTRQSPDHAVISVKDQGPGFSSADRQFLFQKFKKLSARPTGGESSNGLGLAIVKTLVDRLRGNIELKSEPGKGSEFVIHLPNQQQGGS